MPIKRAIWISIVAYAATFVTGVLVGMVLNFPQTTDLSVIPANIFYAGAITAVLVMGIFTWWFFKGETAHANLKNGLYFGLIAVAVGFVLDFLSVVPFGNPIDLLSPYYTQPLFFVTLLLILATTTGTGHFLGTKQNAPEHI